MKKETRVTEYIIKKMIKKKNEKIYIEDRDKYVRARPSFTMYVPLLCTINFLLFSFFCGIF